MNKTFKGCLLILFLCILGAITTVYLFNNKIDNDFKIDRKSIEDSWDQYKTTIYYRDSILSQNISYKNIFHLLQLTQDNLKNNGNRKDLLNNEFSINDSLLGDKNLDNINEKLNNSLSIYNSGVRQFNVKYSTFPYSTLRRKKGFDLYDYFNIDYGNSNDEIKRKQKKVDDWVKYGGKLTE